MYVIITYLSVIQAQIYEKINLYVSLVNPIRKKYHFLFSTLI